MKQISDSSALPLGSSGSEAEPLAKALIEKAIQAFKSNNLQGSVAALDEATRIAPNYHRAWMTKAELMSTLEQKSAAIACYDAALAIQPDDHLALTNKGNALYDLGQNEAAIACYAAALAIQPDLHDALTNKGTALADLGQQAAAIACYDAALAIKPVRTKPGLGEEVRQVVPFSAKILCG
ncbi:MAG: tetratricopeptide repeat protein [Nodosilinea sp.]